MTEEERRRRLIAMGLDPTQYRYVTNEEKAYEETTGGGAFLTGVGQSVGGGIGGLGGAAIGASYGSALGPFGTLAGGIGGGLIGGLLGGMGQSAAEDAFLDDAEEQALALKRQIALEKYPKLTLTGQFAPSLIAARPSFTTIRNIPGALANAPTRSQTAIQRYALASSGFGGGLEAGIEAGSQALRGGITDWSRVGAAGLLGATLTEPTRAFGKIGATVARKGETSKQFLERTGMLRPLTEVEAIARNAEIAAKHQKSLKEATEKADRELDAAEAVKQTEAEVKAEAEEARRTEPTKAEEGDAEKQINRDIDAADTARMKAHGAWVKADNELNNLPPDLNDTPFVAKARRNVAELKAASDEAAETWTNLKNDRVRMRKERAAKELEANDLWERHARRKAAIDGVKPRPLPDNLLDIAQGLAAKLGITWHEAVPKLHAMDKAGKRIDLRGKYNLREHSITLDKLEAQADTPFHEYLHGLWQVLKRSADRKHRGLVELFENDLFKDSPRWQELKSSGERKVWSEERIVESTGKALSERMDNPPKGWIDKFNRWLDDWRLERDARKGFPVKEGELSDKHFQRIVDWMAMRGERQPALQPRQLELMLGDLAVRSPLDSFGPLSGGKRYVDDIKTEEAVAADEAAPPAKKAPVKKAPVKKAPTDPIDKLKAKVADGKKITVSHVGADDLSGMSQDNLRKIHFETDLASKLRLGLGGASNKLDQKTINLKQGQNFLEGAGHGADIVVLHRIPDERLAGADPEQTGPTAKGHTGKNWRDAVAKSNAELVYVTWYRNAVDFEGRDFIDTPGYKVITDASEPQDGLFLTVLKKEKAPPVEDIRGQAVDDSSYVAAVEAGDVDAQQRMVNDAAQKAGYITGPVYHGSEKEFNKFRGSRKGTWVAFDKSGAQPGGWDTPRKVYNLFADPGSNPVTLTKEAYDAWRFSSSGTNWIKKFFEGGWRDGFPASKGTGYSGAQPEVRAGTHGTKEPTSVRVGDYALVVRKPNQLKSADPVTRDNKGNVIPLSKRFDLGVEDIRYQPVEFDPDDKAWQATELRLRKEFDVRPRNTKLPELPEDIRAYVHDYMVERLRQYGELRVPGTRVFKDGKLVAMDEKEHNYQDAFTVSGEAAERLTGRTAKDEADALTPPTLMELFKDQVRLRSGNEPSPLQNSNLLRIALHRYAEFLQKNADYTPPWMRFQPVKPEEFAAAVDVMAKHDPTLLKKYSKRVRGKMMDRIKAGTFSVARGQQILARFVNKPFPEDMSGEEIAQVINGLEMYHGSGQADAIRREGFKGEELSPSGIIGRGIYMTPTLRMAKSYGYPISIRTNFKKLLDLNHNYDYLQSVTRRAADDKARNAMLLEQGYDGLTYKAGGGYREVVAFREPFQQATDQLHEYYGGERLQDVDTFLEDMNEYQLNTNTDHFSSNPASKQPWLLDSIVEKIRKTGHKGSEQEQKTAGIVANAADATARDAQRLEGEFLEAFEFIEQRKVSLSQEDGQHAAIYMAYMRRGMPEGIPADTMARYNAPDSPVKHYVDFFYRNYTETRRRQIEANMKIWHPKAGELLEAGTDPAYAPEMMNQDMWRILSGKEGAKARSDAKKELVDWWEDNLDEPGSITRDELEQAADDYVARLSGGSAHLGSTKFGALRKAESIGLPLRLEEDGSFAWIENHAGRAYQRYMRRFARDFSFFKNMESNDFVRQALGLMKQDKTYDAALPQGDNPFHVKTKREVVAGETIEMNRAMTTDKNLNDFIKAYLGYYEGDELFGRTANRLVVSHWLGVMSGVRDLFSSYVFALPHLRGVDMPLMLTSLKDIGRNWKQSHLLGVNKSHYNRLEFATETHNKLADTINRWSDIVSKYSGRTPLERITRAAQFGIGRAAVMQHMGLAEGASVTADRNLRRLGQMSGVDVKALRNHANKDLTDFKIPDEQLDDMLDRMAASWVDANQGTYDVRGVPMFTMHGPMANFTSLARWNVEKLNMTRKELVNPIVDEGDWRPFIKATLGAAFTGTLLIELSEFINNKFRANPTLAEAVREGDKEEMTYAVADSLNYAGYFGLASALFNDTAIAISRGQRPRTGGVVFPAFDFIGGSLMEPLFDASTAITEGAEPLPTVFDAFRDVLKNTMQTYRILHNHTLGSEDVDKQNIRRDLRIFRRFEGVRGMPPSSDVGNRYLRPDTREFKEAETIQESIDLLPAAFEEQRERAKGRGDKLKSYASGLYTIPDKTLPAISTPEGVEEFMRYKDYIMRQRGGGTWQRIFNDWARNKQMTATKKVLVKSYVQHLMDRGE